MVTSGSGGAAKRQTYFDSIMQYDTKTTILGCMNSY